MMKFAKGRSLNKPRKGSMTKEKMSLLMGLGVER
jgi:hypothetical protein